MKSRPHRRILIGYDGSDCSRRALEFAASLADDQDEVIVATVAPVSFGGPDPLFADKQKLLLEQGKGLLAAHGVDAGTIGPLDEDAARGLVRTAKEMGADPVVVGTHGLGGFRRLALGSVAASVVQHATSSVLVVH